MAVRSRVAVGVDIRIEWGGGERRAFGRLAMSLSCLRSLLITSTDNQIGKLESNKFSLLSQTLTLLSLKGVHLLLSSGKNLICESLSELSFSGWQTVLLHLIRFELCLSWKYFYTHLCFPMGKYLRKWSFCPCTHWSRNEGSLMNYLTSWSKKVRIFPIFSWKYSVELVPTRFHLLEPPSVTAAAAAGGVGLTNKTTGEERAVLALIGKYQDSDKVECARSDPTICSKLCQISKEEKIGQNFFSRQDGGEFSGCIFGCTYLAARTTL